MARPSTTKLLLTLATGLLLSSAVLAQAQTCTTTYNPLLQQYETQCTPGLASMMQSLSPKIEQYDPLAVRQQQLAVKQQQLQNQIMLLQLQELQRQQALRQHNSQR